MKAIIGRKMGMTEVFAKDGTMYAVSVVEVLPNEVTQVKEVEKDGHAALQIGYEDEKETRLNKCEKGIFAKAKVSPKKHLAEIHGDEMNKYKVGDKITASLFHVGDVVDVIGTSKGKGFSGTIKRWGHKIGPKGHGSGYHRGQGSFANNGRTNNRVIPGKKMSGHAGNQQSTILNLVVIEVNDEKNYILIKGAIPGPRRSLVTIRSAIKAQRHKPVVKELASNLDASNISAETIIEEAPVAVAPQVEAVKEVKADAPAEKKGE
ncbi:MAG: 50S ribosomal protein L3 [Bacilli bacterium]|jgi:large subunit ribosomal protein L3